MRFLAALVVLVIVASGCRREEAAVPAEQGAYAYRLTQEGRELWVAPATGAWRSEGLDGSAVLQIHVYSDGRYYREIGKNDRYAHVGSLDQLGANGKEPKFLGIVRANEPLTPGQVVEGLRVEERLSLRRAEARGLFDVPVDRADWVDRELDPGARSHVVAAYWFGPELGVREAFRAIEIETPGERVHITCYGDPAELGVGRTHCLSGRGQPRREVQVVSRPLDDPLVRRELARLERDGAGRAIRLENDESAVLYRRAVVTETTLVTFVGRLDLALVASRLRRL